MSKVAAITIRISRRNAEKDSESSLKSRGWQVGCREWWLAEEGRVPMTVFEHRFDRESDQFYWLTANRPSTRMARGNTSETATSGNGLRAHRTINFTSWC